MPIEFIQLNSHEHLAEKAAHMLVDQILRKPSSTLVFATGYSPCSAYRRFVKNVKAEGIDTSRMTVVKLDEWIGLPLDHPSTCEHFLQSEIIRPLNISSDHYISFDSLCVDKDVECANIELELEKLGGIDLMVLGVGVNGHLGLNEPSLDLCCAVHSTKLTDETRSHQMLVGSELPVTQGLTLGLTSIFQAKNILLLLCGTGKAHIMEYLQQNCVSTRLPVSLLHLHSHVVCLVDPTISKVQV